MGGDAPGGAVDLVLGFELQGELAVGHVDDTDHRIADSGEGVGDVGDAAEGELAAVGAKGDAASAADVGAEAGVVLVERGSGSQVALEGAGGNVPFLEDA